MNNAIEIDKLRKNFSDLQAVQGIQLDMRQGEIFSLPATAVLPTTRVCRLDLSRMTRRAS